MPLNFRNSSDPQKEKAAVSKKEEAQKIEAASAAVEPTYEDGVLFSKSGTIAFVAPLGDPSKPDRVTDPTTGKPTITPYIVGYRFKALEDMEVPDCGLGEDCKRNIMSFANKNGRKSVKAGETFDLTRFETGLLLAAPEFNGRISGEGVEFTAVYQTKTVVAKNGKIGQVSSATEIPTVALKKSSGSGSIKDYKILEVLTCQLQENENGTKRKLRTINPGFEKWEPLCKATATRTKGSESSAPRNTRNAKAQAFLDIVAKK